MTLLYPKGTEFLEDDGRAFAVAAVDIHTEDIPHFCQFEFADKDYRPRRGGEIPQPIERVRRYGRGHSIEHGWVRLPDD